jgi:U3 small nucleolar RNA-associated protein 5
MVWVQWTLITHGGYIAGQPDLVRKLGELNKVIEERARGLQSLLLLKGKLDMLESQMELRRSMQTQRRIDEDSDNEDGVIYVEDQDEEASDKDSGLRPQKLATNGDLEDISDAESDDMPTTSGAIADSEDDDESSEEYLIDDEAEESDAETGDEDDVDHEDHDSDDGDEDSDEGVAPPRKMLKSSGAFSRRK